MAVIYGKNALVDFFEHKGATMTGTPDTLKTDPAYGYTKTLHDGSLIGTSLYCTCGFYVPPQEEATFALDKFREHVVAVKGIGYAQDALNKVSQTFQTVPTTVTKAQAKAMGKDMAFGTIYGGGQSISGAGISPPAYYKVLDVGYGSDLDGDESFPEEAKEPFWDYAKFVKSKDAITKALAESKQGTIYGGGPYPDQKHEGCQCPACKEAGNPLTISYGPTPPTQPKPAPGDLWFDIDTGVVKPISPTKTKQTIVFTPGMLTEIGSLHQWGNATVPPPANWLLDYAVKHFDIPKAAVVDSVMKTTLGTVAVHFSWAKS